MTNRPDPADRRGGARASSSRPSRSRWRPLTTADGDDGPSPDRVDRLLDTVLAGLGSPTVDVLVTIHERWTEVVGAEVAPHTRPLRVVDGVLAIEVDNPAWVNHLRWAEADVLARLGTIVGADGVTALRVTRRR